MTRVAGWSSALRWLDMGWSPAASRALRKPGSSEISAVPADLLALWWAEVNRPGPGELRSPGRAACGEMWCSLRTSCRLTVTACTREDRDLGYIATSATCDRSAGDLRTMQAGARGVTGRTWRAVCVQLGTVLAGGLESRQGGTGEWGSCKHLP